MADQAPWLKYQQAAPAEGPWSRYQGGGAPEAPKQEGGFFERIWAGLGGGDVSRAGQFGKGMANPFYKGAQIGARMMAEPGGGVPEQAGAPPGPDRIKEVDTAVKRREQQYATKRKEAKQDTEGLFSNIWERLGEIASPVTLAAGGAAGKAIGAAGSLGGKLAMGGLTGAAVAPTMTPVRDTKNFGKEVASEAGGGLVGGVLGTAVGEAGASLLGKAIAGNSPQMVEKALTERYRSVVKPGTRQRTEPALGLQDRRFLTAMDRIIDNAPKTQLTGEAGNPLPPGSLPQTLRQFAQGIDANKRDIFAQYDLMAAQAGDEGVKVDLAPVVQQLRDLSRKPEVIDLHPAVAADAQRLADTWAARGQFSPSEAQSVIQNLNETLSGFYKNPTHETVSRGSMLEPVAKTLREQLDGAISAAKGPGYQALRDQYSALKSVEQDVVRSVQREANKVRGGIGGIFADIAASEEAIRGVISLDPSALARAGAIKGAQLWMRHINSPNRAITRMFQMRSQSKMPTDTLMQAMRRSPVAGALAGGASTIAPATGAVAGAQAGRSAVEAVAPPGLR